MTTLQGPAELLAAVAPVFDKLPLERAMTRLVVEGEAISGGIVAVDAALAAPGGKILRDKPPLLAGLWLFVDELDRSHKVSQSDEIDPTLSYWHGIMHRREGDFSNSHYWFRRVGNHPAMKLVGDGYDSHTFIDKVEATHNAGATDESLIALQRREWVTLMRWCAENR